MTDKRTPAKRVGYPDLYVAPDGVDTPAVHAHTEEMLAEGHGVTHQGSMASWAHHASVVPAETGPHDYASVIRCFGYNDGSSYGSGHPDELLFAWPPNDLHVGKAGPPLITPALRRYVLTYWHTHTHTLHMHVLLCVFVCVYVSLDCMTQC